MPIQIKEKPEDVVPLLSFVKAGADSAKEELGFLPEKAYDDLAVSGKLLVATVGASGKEIYAGHLMFGGIYPHAKVFQLFVEAGCRGNGIARRLISHLKERLTAKQWLSIKASVADDLAANDVWAHMGFRVVRTRAGGNARKRRINVRVLDLDTPSLFGLMRGPVHQEGLRLAERLFQRPIYLIDLNVLFDTIRKRRRSSSAAKVIRAGFSNSIRLMVAAEFTAELLRTSADTSNDPILAFASQLDFLSRPPEKIVHSLVNKLAPVIFPDRAAHGTLTERDMSDLVHIATAIHHGAAGFITSENAILRASDYLHKTHRIDVIGLEEFARIVDVGVRVPRASTTNLSSGTLRTNRCDETDLANARIFLTRMHAETAFIHEALACQGGRAQWLLVTSGSAPLGFAKWEVHGGLKRAADVYLCVDEGHHAAETIIDHLLDTIPRELSGVAPTLVRLHIPSGQIMTRQAALSMGFLPPEGASDGTSKLQRLAVGLVVSAANWASARQSLVSVAALSLPAQPPTFATANPYMLVNTGQRDIEMSLAEIERVLSPVLFLFQGRGGVIVPIQEQYARELLGSSPQLSMLDPPEAILRRERVYISAPNTLRRMTPGTPMLFYESLDGNGRGCVIALARITDSRVVSKVEALGKVKQRGVLDDRTLQQRSVGEEVTETSFDNIFLFKSPVPLKRLRQLGCADGSNLISARTISFDKLAQVVKEGRIDG
ncbi:GNAT family N-acetyltransferase [Nitrospirillum sp. BR 11752]|uniref:GNAT family N-acetyltransferase n=1 Tax=Nitrospirillum sp. BR 11752 TaxID=3104293 RepID=UPI002EC38355|nr:GNAT family N-acetyltransferase [Nitrospirillum sp. BR 11752]